MPEPEVVIITPEQPLNMDYGWFFFPSIRAEIQAPASRAQYVLHLTIQNKI